MSSVVVGYFGYDTNQLDGQTIKTREVYDLIRMEIDADVTYFDTESLKENKLYLFFLIKMIIGSDKIFYLPGQSNLKYIFPLIFILASLFQNNIYMLAVGGWLYEFVQRHPLLKLMLKRLPSILVETNFLKHNLGKLGFHNVDIIPNFRNHNFDITSDQLKVSENSLSFVFMARVMQEKGLDTLFEYAELLQNQPYSDPIKLDIYGPISEKYQDVFFNELQKYNFIEYKGVVDSKDVYNILYKYDALVFPTYYEGEGFPGTVIDSYISGIPVITTFWKQLPEFVKDGETGFLVEVKNARKIYEIVGSLIMDKERLLMLKRNALAESKIYSKEIALEIIRKNTQSN